MKTNSSRMRSLLSTVALLTVVTLPLQAKEPVPRFFATAGMPCINWEADDSIGIAAKKDKKAQGVIEFITPGGAYNDDDAIVRDAEGNVLIDLRRTRWVQIPVVHVTSDGVEEIRQVYWLAENLDGDGKVDLPKGVTTAGTGPSGDVMNFVEIRINQAPASDLDNPGKYYLSPTGTVRFCIAIGRFTK